MVDVTNQVIDNPASSRYELYVDDELAGFVDYVDEDGVVALPHTRVLPAFEGHGLGSELVVGTLTALAEQGREVLPYCPFIPVVIKRHPELADLVPQDRRSQFGLS